MAHFPVQYLLTVADVNSRYKLWVGSLIPGLSCQYVEVYWEGTELWSCCWWADQCFPQVNRWIRRKLFCQFTMSVYAKLHILLNTLYWLPFWLIELQGYWCSTFPKGHWINTLSCMHFQWRSRLPVWLVEMWQMGRSFHAVLLCGPALLDVWEHFRHKAI